MLVLTRKLRETIQISDNISVTILRIHGNSVRIGIDAPRHIRIVRGEIPINVAPNDDENASVHASPTNDSNTDTSIDDAGFEDGGSGVAHLLPC